MSMWSDTFLEKLTDPNGTNNRPTARDNVRRTALPPPVPDFRGELSAADTGPAQDPVNHPSHYAGKVECIDAIEAATDGLSSYEGYLVGNAVKYVWRHDKKNGTQDLEKARWYIDRLIASRKARGAK